MGDFLETRDRNKGNKGQIIGGMTAEENALLDARMEDFRRNPDSGIRAEELGEHMRQRLHRE